MRSILEWGAPVALGETTFIKVPKARPSLAYHTPTEGLSPAPVLVCLHERDMELHICLHAVEGVWGMAPSVAKGPTHLSLHMGCLLLFGSEYLLCSRLPSYLSPGLLSYPLSSVYPPNPASQA